MAAGIRYETPPVVTSPMPALLIADENALDTFPLSRDPFFRSRNKGADFIAGRLAEGTASSFGFDSLRPDTGSPAILAPKSSDLLQPGRTGERRRSGSGPRHHRHLNPPSPSSKAPMTPPFCEAALAEAQGAALHHPCPLVDVAGRGQDEVGASRPGARSSHPPLWPLAKVVDPDDQQVFRSSQTVQLLHHVRRLMGVCFRPRH